MISESRFTAKLLRALRAHPALRDAVIWKVSDRLSAGRPDVQIFLKGITTYFEIKVRPNVCTKLQAYYIEKLYPRAFVIISEQDGKSWLIMVSDRHGDRSSNTGLICNWSDFVEEIVRRCEDA